MSQEKFDKFPIKCTRHVYFQFDSPKRNRFIFFAGALPLLYQHTHSGQLKNCLCRFIIFLVRVFFLLSFINVNWQPVEYTFFCRWSVAARTAYRLFLLNFLNMSLQKFNMQNSHCTYCPQLRSESSAQW